MMEQLKAVALTLVLAVVGTIVIAYAVKAVLGLRPSEEAELAGLDITDHGEEGYHGGSAGGGHLVMPEPAGTPAMASVPAMSKALNG